MFRRLILVATFIYLVIISYAQQADPYISRFFAVPVDETVFLRWTISAGNTCEDTHIERSGDGISYERIGIIGGICGSPDQAMTYEFTDTLPLFNRASYYRLELGYYGLTSPKIVEIYHYNEFGYLLGPNPFRDFTRLVFDNENAEEHKMILTDMQGRIVLEMETTGEEFIIRREDQNSGLYFFRVSANNSLLFQGKLIIQ